LYSDGRRIWVVGANRLYALDTDLSEEATASSVPEPAPENTSDSEKQDTKIELFPGASEDGSGYLPLEHPNEAPSSFSLSNERPLDFDDEEDA